MPGKPITVEFVGLPASGKSFLADRLVSDLSREGVEIVSFRKVRWPEYLPGVGRQLFVNPRRIWTALSVIFAATDAKARKSLSPSCRWWCSRAWWNDYSGHFSRWFGWRKWQRDVVSESDFAIAQPVELLLQLTWRFLFWLPADQAQKVFERIRNQIPVSDIVVILSIDLVELVARLDNTDRPRGLGRINRELRKHRDNFPFLRERFAYIDWVADFARAQPSKPLVIDLRTDGEDGAEALATKLSQKILEHLR